MNNIPLPVKIYIKKFLTPFIDKRRKISIQIPPQLIIPPENASEEEMKKFAHAILDNYINNQHQKYLQLIFDQLGVHLDQNLHNFRIMKQILDVPMTFGTIFILTSVHEPYDSNKKQYILKMQRISKPIANNPDSLIRYREIINESNMQEQFALRNLAPKIYVKKLLDTHEQNFLVQLIIMDKLNENTLVSLLRQPDLTEAEVDQIGAWLIALLKTLSDNKLIHGDLHIGNIGIEFDLNAQPLQLVPKLIDFEFSSMCNNNEFRNFHLLDLLQLARSLCFSWIDQKIKVKAWVTPQLLDILYEYYEDNYANLNLFEDNYDFQNYDRLEEEYSDLLYKYLQNFFIPKLIRN